LDLLNKLEQKKAWAGIVARLAVIIAANKSVFFKVIAQLWQRIKYLLKVIGVFHYSIIFCFC